MKFFPLRFFAAICCAIIISGCGKQASPPTQNDTVRFAMEKDLSTLDPANLTDPITFRVMGQIYEGLLTLDENNQAQPAIAESWTSNDKHDVWTFTIRKGVYFQSSPVFGSAQTRELTPDDVVYSLTRSVAPGMVSGFALGNVIDGADAYTNGKAQSVSGLRVLDGNRVEVHLTHPELYFPYRLTSPYIAIYPKEAVDQGADVFAKQHPIGTGPYQVVSASDTELSLERNDKYWRGFGPGAPRKVVFRVIQNEQLRQLEFKNGKIDILPVTPGLMPSFLEKSAGGVDQKPVLTADLQNNYGLYANADFNSYFIAFQAEKVPAAVRKAINLAVDRDEIIRTITYGTAIPREGTIPTGMQGYQAPFKTPVPDPEAAKRVLIEAGLVPGSVKVELLVHELDSSEALGELLQARLKPAGINLVLRKVDFNEAMRLMSDGNFEALAMKFQYIYSSPEPILTSIYSSKEIPDPNIWHYRSPQVDLLIDSYSAAQNRDDLNRISAQIETVVFADSPAVFLYQAQSLFVFPKSLSGLTFNGHGMPLLYKVNLGGN